VEAVGAKAVKISQTCTSKRGVRQNPAARRLRVTTRRLQGCKMGRQSSHRVLVAVTLLASAEGSEVLGGLWDDLVLEGEDDLAGWLSTDGDVEEYLGGGERESK